MCLSRKSFSKKSFPKKTKKSNKSIDFSIMRKKVICENTLLLLSLHNVPCCKTPYLERLSLTIQQTKQIILSQISRRANNATADELIMHYKLVCCCIISSSADDQRGHVSCQRFTQPMSRAFAKVSFRN